MTCRYERGNAGHTDGADDGQVGCRILAYDVRRGRTTVGEDNPDNSRAIRCGLNHVIVRHDRTVGAQDDAGTFAGAARGGHDDGDHARQRDRGGPGQSFLRGHRRTFALAGWGFRLRCGDPAIVQRDRGASSAACGD